MRFPETCILYSYKLRVLSIPPVGGQVSGDDFALAEAAHPLAPLRRVASAVASALLGVPAGGGSTFAIFPDAARDVSPAVARRLTEVPACSYSLLRFIAAISIKLLPT